MKLLLLLICSVYSLPRQSRVDDSTLDLDVVPCKFNVYIRSGMMGICRNYKCIPLDSTRGIGTIGSCERLYEKCFYYFVFPNNGNCVGGKCISNSAIGDDDVCDEF
jgi:hypothetical protein